MERLNPTFLSREQQEDIQFYKDWIRTALFNELSVVGSLLALKKRLNVSLQENNLLLHYGLDPEHLRIPEAALDAKIQEEVSGAAHDLQATIFDGGLFQVGIETEGGVIAIDGITSEGHHILPVIDGEVYTGPFTDVLFDR